MMYKRMGNTVSNTPLHLRNPMLSSLRTERLTILKHIRKISLKMSLSSKLLNTKCKYIMTLMNFSSEQDVAA